jgi:hypothetical protein
MRGAGNADARSDGHWAALPAKARHFWISRDLKRRGGIAQINSVDFPINGKGRA